MAYTRRVLEKAFDKKFDDIFVSFNPEPLGIGAVAQVGFFLQFSIDSTLTHQIACLLLFYLGLQSNSQA
jgi:hypothetical protein